MNQFYEEDSDEFRSEGRGLDFHLPFGGRLEARGGRRGNGE